MFHKYCCTWNESFEGSYTDVLNIVYNRMYPLSTGYWCPGIFSRYWSVKCYNYGPSFGLRNSIYVL
jgi:hypothetical protein